MDTARGPSRASDKRLRLGLLAAAGGLIWLAGLALLWSLADLHARQSFRQQAQLENEAARTGRMPEVSQWQAVFGRLQAARSLDAGNPNTIEQAAGLLAMRVKDGERYRDASPLARDHWVRAVTLRPASAYAWANLAASKYQMGEIDGQLYAAMRNAATLGPWEPEVQLSVIDTGFALWDEMPAALHETVLALARNGERRNANEVLNIAERRGRLVLVCASAKLGNMAACRIKSDA